MAEEPDEFRKRADSLSAKVALATDNGSLPEGEAKRLMQELSTYQVELEMQNEALRSTQLTLQASQSKLYRLYQHSPVGNVTISDLGRIDQCNQRFMALIGRDEAHTVGRILAEFVAPSDRLVFDQWIRRADRQDRTVFIKFIDANRAVKHIQLSLTELAPEGDMLSALVTCVDVTDLRLAQDRARLATAVFETTSEAVVVTDADYRIIMVNPAYTQITGYTSAEVVGKTPTVLKSDRHDADFFARFWRQLHEHGRWEGEMWNKRKNGEVYAAWQTINVLKGHLNQALYYIGVSSDMSSRKEMESLMRQQATHDTLTGLPNRLLFADRLQQAMHASHRTACPFYLLFLDLDGFKEVNDTLGHDRGDLLLKEVAARLLQCVRDTDTVARLGGDEFAILLMGIQQISSVNKLVQEMLDSIAQGYTLVNERIYVSVSIGITCFPTDGDSTETMLKNADQAMYSAKNGGKNCFRFFTSEMQHKLDARQRISRDLHSADIPNEFVLHYQPIIELGTHRIHKAEALVRWRHPVNGMIPPMQFIPVAEEIGKINEIGNWIFHQAIQDLTRWRKQFDATFQVSINKSPAQFRNDTDDWNLKLDALSLPGNSVVIEITEGLLLEFTDTVKKKLLSYRDKGIEVALDDFGTGYSSLSYIKKLDIDYLKIDQSFVRNLETDPENAVLCEAIIVMAHKLGMKVVAEGIETEGQCRLLTEAACDYGQGYYFSKPLPLDAFESFLASPTRH